MSKQSFIVAGKGNLNGHSLTREDVPSRVVATNVVLLPRIHRKTIVKPQVIPTTSAVIDNVRESSSSSLSRGYPLQVESARSDLPFYHPSQPPRGHVAQTHVSRRRPPAKRGSLTMEEKEWTQASAIGHPHPTNNFDDHVPQPQSGIRRQESICSSCIGSTATTGISSGSTRQYSAVEVDLCDERMKGSLYVMKDAYSTLDTDDTTTGDESHSTSKSSLETVDKETAELKQVTRERNLLRDLLSIIYERELIAEEVRPYCKRALQLCGINPKKK